MSDIGDYWKDVSPLLKREAEQRAQGRRDDAESLFSAARAIAAKNGLLLKKHTDVHYQLRWPDGAILDIYPGRGRLYSNPARKPRSPRLTVPDEWTLVDVVNAAVAAKI